MFSDELLERAVLEVEQAILDSLPDSRECRHDFSLSFQRKMKKLIHRANHIVAYRVLRRVACIVIAFLVSMSMILTFNAEARAAVLDWVKEQFEGVYHYFFVREDVPEERNSYYLDWVPDGYVLRDSIEIDNGVSYLYANSSGDLLYFAYMYGSESRAVMSGRGKYDQKYIVDGTFCAEVFLALDSVETNIITWTGDNGSVIFTITGYLGEEDLIKIAKSVISEK